MKADGTLEMKKQLTFERGTKSKVLVVYAIESEADKIDQALIKVSFKRVKHLSHKRTAPHQRMTAMHVNELINVRARYEALCNANLKDVIAHNNSQCVLEDFILDQKE